MVTIENLVDEDSSDISRKGTPNPWEINRRREIIKKIAGFPRMAKDNYLIKTQLDSANYEV